MLDHEVADDLSCRSFSRESLSQLEVCLKSDLETGFILGLAGECVSVLVSEEILMSCLSSLATWTVLCRSR
jgi:hypothetical protein